MFTFFVVRAAAASTTPSFSFPSAGTGASFPGFGATAGAFPGAGATAGAFPGFAGSSFQATGSSFPAGSFTPGQTLPSGATPTLDSRGLPVGTATGIVDSDLLGLNIGNVPWIGNPRLGQNYQTQASDQLLSSLYSTGRYNTLGGRINTPFPGYNLGTLDIPFSINNGGLATGGITTTTNGGIPITSQVNNLAFQNPLTSTFAPSISNAFLPTSSQFLNANLAPWATAPSSNLPGIGYSANINPPSAFNGGLPLGYNYGNAIALNQPQLGGFGAIGGFGQTQFGGFGGFGAGLGQTQFGGLGALGATQFGGLGAGQFAGLGQGAFGGLYGGY